MAHNQPYERTPMLPTGLNRSIQPTPASATSRTAPTPNVAFFNENKAPRESPFRPGCNPNTVFFTDLAFRRDVEDFFAFTGQERLPPRDSRRNAKYSNEAASVPRYNPAEDDLAVWKKRLVAEGGVKDSNAQDNDGVIERTEDMRRG